MYSFCLLPEK